MSRRFVTKRDEDQTAISLDCVAQKKTLAKPVPEDSSPGSRYNSADMLKECVLFFCAATLFAQDRPGLFFREDWKEIPAATPVTKEHVSAADLILSLYGPGKANIRKAHHDTPADDPYYLVGRV